MAEHTKGPWIVGNRYGEDALMSATGETVAYAAWDGGSGCHLAFTNDADANLIAAAPELLEALQAIIADCGETAMDGYVENSLYHTEVDRARAAIARAKGTPA